MEGLSGVHIHFPSVVVTQNLKEICQDFENFVNMLWIRSLIHVDLICERILKLVL